MATPSKATKNIKIAPGAIVTAECELYGDITIGARTVIHPRAKILAEAGPIILGESNLIEEQACIVNKCDDNAANQKVMIIGNNNVFEVGCNCQALKIGDSNVIESKVGRETELSNGCIVGAMCDLSSNELLPENTVVFGATCERRIQSERPPPQTLQLDFLTKILPNYHHLRKPSKLTAK